MFHPGIAYNIKGYGTIGAYVTVDFSKKLLIKAFGCFPLVH